MTRPNSPSVYGENVDLKKMTAPFCSQMSNKLSSFTSLRTIKLVLRRCGQMFFLLISLYSRNS